MAALLVLVKVLYFVLCIALITVVLFQKGKTAGLSGAIGGVGESYWGKNKARTMDGKLQKATVALAVSFIVFALLISYVEKFV
jgi:preprotein translocase subunit SecG